MHRRRLNQLLSVLALSVVRLSESQPLGARPFLSTVENGTWGFSSPRGACTADGVNIYVTDRNNHRIRFVDIASGVVTPFAGTGTSGATNGPALASSFQWPVVCAFNPSGSTMFVTEFLNHQVRAINMATRTVSLLAGAPTVASGSADGIGTNALFNSPVGAAFYNNVLYIGDQGNNAIRAISLTTLVVSTFANAATGAALSGPRAIAISPSTGTVFCADYSNNRIRAIPQSGPAYTVAGGGAAGTRDGTSSSALFNNPYGLSMDASGGLIVSDVTACAVRYVSPASGAVVTLVGGSCGPTADGFTSSAIPGLPSVSLATMGQATGTAVLSSGAVVIVDFSLARIRLLSRPQNSSAGFYSSWSTSGVEVLCPANSFCPANSVAPTPCPQNGVTLYVGAASPAACVTPVATNTTLKCNATSAVSAGSILPSQRIVLPNDVNTDVAPLVILSAASPVNSFGVDIVVASASACASFASTAGSVLCSTQTFPIGTATTYFYLGTAAALNMIAAPSCAA